MGADQTAISGTATESQEGSEPTVQEGEDRDVFAELVGDDDEQADPDPEKAETPADDHKTEAAKDSDEPKDDASPQESKPEVEDNPNDPPRRRIKNLEKIRFNLTKEKEQLTGAFKALNQGFMDAGLDPQRGMDELGMLAKAKSGDPSAQAEVAKRYGIQPTPAAPPAPALTDKQRKLLEEYGMADEFEALGKSETPNPAPETAAPPAKPAEPQRPGNAQPTRDELAAREAFALTASAVRQAEPEHAQAILEKASAILQSKVAKYRSAPGAWGELFREAVGEATAAVKAVQRPAQAKPRPLRGSSGGSGPTSRTPKTGLDSEFPGLFDE